MSTMSSTDSESGSDWEEVLSNVMCQCLFCELEFENGAEAVLEHCINGHNFDLMKFIQENGNEFIFHSYVQFIL